MFNTVKSFILLAIVFLITISCANNKVIRNNPTDYLPRKAFVHLEKSLKATSCGGTQCLSMTYRSSASGFVVKVEDDGVFVITAAHFCENDMQQRDGLKIETNYKAKTVYGEEFSSVMLHYQRDIDVCLMFVKDMTKNVQSLPIADKAPKPGEKIYNISAPASIFVPDMVPILEGRYNGEMGEHACYTLPAAPGSSGSMIINEKGQLVGMVHSVYMNFHVITLSTNYDKLKEFIEKYVRKFLLYKNVMKDLHLDDIFTAQKN